MYPLHPSGYGAGRMATNSYLFDDEWNFEERYDALIEHRYLQSIRIILGNWINGDHPDVTLHENDF